MRLEATRHLVTRIAMPGCYPRHCDAHDESFHIFTEVVDVIKNQILWTIYGSDWVRCWELAQEPNPRDWGGLEHLQTEEVPAFLDERRTEIARLREQIGNDGRWESLVHHRHPVYPAPAARIDVCVDGLGHAVKATLDAKDEDDFVFEGLIVVPGHRLADLEPSRMVRDVKFTRRARDIVKTVRAEQENGTGRSLAFTDSIMCDGELRVLRDFERMLIRAVIDWTAHRDAAVRAHDHPVVA